MNFGQQPTNNIENTVETEHKAEIMKTPLIVIQRERGLEMTSLLLKAMDPEYGDNDSELSQQIREHFEQEGVKESLKPKTDGVVDMINRLGVDQESLYILSLLYNRENREQKIFETISKHKNISPEEARAFWQSYKDVMEAVLRSLDGTEIMRLCDAIIKEDIQMRESDIEDIKARINTIIDFFRPDPNTTPTQTLIFTPTNLLLKRNSGRNFSLGHEQIIISHRENIANQDHEFIHGIINPIIEKVFTTLTDDQRMHILEMASGKLTKDYGEMSFSLLCEEFVRTYNDVFRRGKKPESFEQFKAKLLELSDEEFDIELSQNKSLKARCSELGIGTRTDLIDRAEEYFERFEKNELRDLIFGLYEEYSADQDNQEQNFEDFVTKFLPSRI